MSKMSAMTRAPRNRARALETRVDSPGGAVRNESSVIYSSSTSRGNSQAISTSHKARDWPRIVEEKLQTD